tara:strand:- start:47 stop:1141 length:1095 start_codon:yes stop_codon:yes gene_type:complete
MYFGLSEEQEQFQEYVKKFLDDNVTVEEIRKIAKGEDDKLKQEIYSGLINLGINALLVPEEHGGLGAELLSAVAVAQSLGAGVGPIPFTGAYVMAPLAINLGGNQEQQSKYLPLIASNEAKFGVGLSEYVAAREDANVDFVKGKVNGKALFVIDADQADYYILSNKGGTMFIVDAKDAGIEKIQLTSVDKTRTYTELRFKEVAGEVLEASEKDPSIIKKVIDAGRIIYAADSLGASESMIEKAVSYAKERKQFNRVIGSFQAVKHMCAEMAADLEPCYAMLWQAAYSFDHDPDEARLQACQAKSHISEVAKMVSKKATEVHGGMGFTDLLGLHYWFKRIGLNRQLLGGPELVREEAAEIQGFNQ